MDLSNLAARDKITIQLKNPADPKKPLLKDDGSPMTVTAHTKDSKAYRRAFADIRRDAKNSDGDVDAADLGMELIKRIVVDWDLQFDGERPSREQVDALLEDEAYSWFSAQIDAAVHDRTGFFDPPSSN